MKQPSILDLQGNLSQSLTQSEQDKYIEISKNPDLLGRLFRVFMLKNCHPSLWKTKLEEYIETHGEVKGASWVNDKNTNLTRTMFSADTVSWTKFLEGLLVLRPAFDTIDVELFTDLNDGLVSSLRIHKTVLLLNEATPPPLPKGEVLIPLSFERSPLEPLPLKVVRDSIAPIGSATELRKIIRKNIAPYTHSTKINITTNSLYTSAIKSEMTWSRMLAIVFAVGASFLMVRIKAKKAGKTYTSIVEVRNN